jgi:hypothetical protein
MQQEHAMDKLWAFVKGAALHAGAVGYWANRPEPQPYGLHDFVAENIRQSCGADAQHGFAGRAWAAEAPLSASLEDAILGFDPLKVGSAAEPCRGHARGRLQAVLTP